MHAATPHDLHATCANCQTALQGAFCHVCGQHGHNPLRSLRHAVEDVFESFWHLDGRVFRTLRDLCVPGRVACNYLDGQRVRYIPPLRLFVILTVITFFVGRLVTGLAGDDATGAERSGGARGEVGVQVGAVDAGQSAFAAARTEGEVDAALQRQLAEIGRARTEARAVPFMGAAMDRAEAELRSQADARIVELRAARPAGARPPVTQAGTSLPGANPAKPVQPGTRPATDAPGPSPSKARPQAAAATSKSDSDDGVQALVRMIDSGRLRTPGKPWHETDNPVDLQWLPAFADRWFNHRLANVERNTRRMEEGGGAALFAQSVLAAVPSALFLMLPVFALLLRLFYATSPRGYLEHLVVALYSHAFLLLALLATFVMVSAQGAMGAAKPLSVLSLIALWIWVPIYLLLTQRRVYREHWAITVVKYGLIGFAYQFLIVGAAIYTVLASISSGA